MTTICLKRTQDLQGNNDKFCKECWIDDPDLARYYARGRQECMQENCVTEEEFDELEKRRHAESEPLSAVKAGSSKGA